MRFTSTQQQSYLRQHSTLIGKLHLSFSSQPSFFLPQPSFFMSSSASLSSFDLQPQNLMPYPRHDHPLSSAHAHTNEHFLHSQLICSFIQAQHEHQICRSFYVFELYSTIALAMDLSVLRKIPMSLSYRHHASLPYSFAGLM